MVIGLAIHALYQGRYALEAGHAAHLLLHAHQAAQARRFVIMALAALRTAQEKNAEMMDAMDIAGHAQEENNAILQGSAWRHAQIHALLHQKGNVIALAGGDAGIIIQMIAWNGVLHIPARQMRVVLVQGNAEQNALRIHALISLENAGVSAMDAVEL